MSKKSLVSIFLKLTAVLIFIAGVVGGYILIVSFPQEHLPTSSLFSILFIAAAFIISFLMLGIAKIIDSLQQQQSTLEQIVYLLQEQQLTQPEDSKLEEILPEF